MSDHNTKSYLDEFLGDSDNWVLFQQERLAYVFGDFIEGAMESQQIPQAALAERLRKSPSVISRALNAGSNLTLRTMVELAAAVGYQIVDFKMQQIPALVSTWWMESPTVPDPMARDPSNKDVAALAAFMTGVASSCHERRQGQSHGLSQTN